MESIDMKQQIHNINLFFNSNAAFMTGLNTSLVAYSVVWTVGMPIK
jgi:hypothetical protein